MKQKAFNVLIEFGVVERARKFAMDALHWDVILASHVEILSGEETRADEITQFRIAACLDYSGGAKCANLIK